MNCLVTKLGEVINNPNLDNFEVNEYVNLIASKFANGIPESEYPAFYSFIKSLTSNGIIDKIQYMALPMFASNSGEAIQNVILDSQSIPSISAVSLTDKCISFNAAGNVDLTSHLKGGIANKMFFVSAIKNYALTEGSQLLVKFNNTNNNSSVSITSSGGMAKETVIMGSQTTYSLAPIDNYHTLAISVDGTAGTMNYYGLSGNTYTAQTKSVSVPSAMSKFMMNGNAETWFGKCDANIRILIVGNELLTIQEVQSLHDAVDAFVKNW